MDKRFFRRILSLALCLAMCLVFIPSAAMADGKPGWVKEGGLWYYYYDEYNYCADGSYWIENEWFFFDASGALQTGWFKVGSKTYYGRTNGMIYINETVTIEGKSYTFDKSGALVK